MRETQQYSRREAIPILLSPLFSPLLNREGSASITEEQVEQELGIQLTTLKETMESEGKYFDQNNYFGYTPLWDTDRLYAVKSCQLVLPSHFRQLKNGRKLSLNLYPSFGMRETAFADNEKYEIQLGYDSFTPEDVTTSLRVLAHEETHLLQPSTIDGDVTHSPWYDKVTTIIGKDFSDFATYTSPLVTEKIYEAHFVSENDSFTAAEREEELIRLLQRYEYGISRDDPREFIAVLSEYYLYGHEVFSELNTNFLSAEKVSGLYDFVKNDIFLGKEYNYFPLKNMLF